MGLTVRLTTQNVITFSQNDVSICNLISRKSKLVNKS